MAGRMRHYKKNKDRKVSKPEEPKDLDETSPIIISFRGFQSELDDRHDRYERLVKISRDVTIDSKRVIFGLHRIKSDNKATVLTEAAAKIKDILKHFQKIATELSGLDSYQYVRAFSPGLQEYIEAVSYYHYLKEGNLVTLTEITDDLHFSINENDGEMSETLEKTVGRDEDDQTVPAPESSTSEDIKPAEPSYSATSEKRQISVLVTPLDYVLGIADLTGELMRLAINSIGAGNLDLPFKLCCFIREIHDAFVLIGNRSRELPRKLSVLRQSLHKVEAACYTLQVRGSEIPKHMLADVIVSTPVDIGDYDHEESADH